MGRDTMSHCPSQPMTILGTPILQHPQPQSAQASSGIISPSPSAPTSQRPATAHQTTEPLPLSQPIPNIGGLPRSGTNPPRSTSTHPSLYERSRNLSPAPQPSLLARAATGRMSRSSVHRFDPDITEDVGNESTDSSGQSHNLHQSYSRPLSCDMSTSLTRQVARVLSSSFPNPSHYSQTQLPSPMESQSPSRPPSHRSRAPTLTLPVMTLSDAIRFYQRTATGLSVTIPEELKRAEYRELYNYYAYELPFILTWGKTQAGNDYFMKKN